MKTLLLTLIISVSAFAQIDFTTQFPKIGYGDHFMTMQSPLYYGTSNPQNWSVYSGALYYYPRLVELGLSHVVTFGGSYSAGGYSIGAIPFDSSFNPTLKVLDVYFTMRLSRYNGSTPFSGSMYAGAQGNAQAIEYYQVGGSQTDYSKDGGYGFRYSNSNFSLGKITPAFVLQ